MSTTFMTWLGFAAMVLIAVTFTWRPAYATLRPPRHRLVAFLFGSQLFLLMAFLGPVVTLNMAIALMGDSYALRPPRPSLMHLQI